MVYKEIGGISKVFAPKYPNTILSEEELFNHIVASVLKTRKHDTFNNSIAGIKRDFLEFYAMEYIAREKRLSQTISYDIEIDNKETKIRDIIKDPKNYEDEVINSIYIKDIIKRIEKILPIEQLIVLKLRFGIESDNPRSYREIADIVNVPQSLIKRRERKAIKTLRVALKSNGM